MTFSYYLMRYSVFYCLAFHCRSFQFGNLFNNSVYSLRVLSIRFSENGLIEDNVAAIASPALMSRRHLLINLRVDCNVLKNQPLK